MNYIVGLMGSIYAGLIIDIAAIKRRNNPLIDCWNDMYHHGIDIICSCCRDGQ